jgi:hypothetical protein
MRVTWLVGLVVLVALALAGAASADKPIMFPNPSTEIVFPEGDAVMEVCPGQTITVTPLSDNGTITIHTRRDGDSWWWLGGHLESTISSSTGKLMTINQSGPGKAIFDDTGFTITGGGHWLVGETAADAHGEGLLLYTGHITIRQDASGTLVTSFEGRPVLDVCAALAV